ncbi:hypothetical protein CFOL_v3_32811 [Cephalotus follicularis]|uniref:DUF7054 domain-containing protein n=1 Tax=Cephalotus follicularis TaxID=3775 RepID=A0A1Q3BQL7_CEPFO|nr:hypothetical protein CFOL_v3_13855 [Cephalotus follicularis]GAV89396.1 hypothetical protein CFOL_v3_32811 [Cephalotus follicularis]
MTEKNLRRRATSTSCNLKSRPLHPSTSPIRRTQPPRRSAKHSKPISIFNRCSSEPSLWIGGGGGGGVSGDDDKLKLRSSASDDGDGVLFRQDTSTDVFAASSPSLLGLFQHSQSFEGYSKDAKVVVNVTVEGSPGPIRTLVKLGSSVDEMIKLVVDKYSEERRTPKLDHHEPFELHHSYFSVQSLHKSELIGDLGCRSFYLRRCCSNHTSNGASMSETVPVRVSSPPPIPPAASLLHSFITRKICKMIRRMHKLWKVMTCWQ